MWREPSLKITWLGFMGIPFLYTMSIPEYSIPMKNLTFKIAAKSDAEQAADLFLDGKELDRATAVSLFETEFGSCENQPDKRVYLLTMEELLLVAYAGVRFYDQFRDENMYGTSERLPTGWYLRGLKVHPERRRTGIARELTKRRLDWLSERSKNAFVFLNDDKKETLPMYSEFGFKTVSTGWKFDNYTHKRHDQRGILLQLTF